MNASLNVVLVLGYTGAPSDYLLAEKVILKTRFTSNTTSRL